MTHLMLVVVLLIFIERIDGYGPAKKTTVW